ncbi:MAG TPA: beta-propeller fold lactonase family protein, partial [Candidatus Hydrogenedentes bacterium]|nr:beta-propeller fold lactonase family protein [Candidatus Hydrogenedentota bacterium]
RHMKFSPDGKFAYVLNELANTVAVFAWDAKAGRLDPVQSISTLPEGYDKENTSAEIRVHPNGKHVYTSNRGHDSIAVFDVDAATGKLTAKGQVPTGGKTPRNFALDPTGAFLLAANQGSGTVVLFRVDPSTGVPAATSEVVNVPVAVCVTFSPAP